MAEKMLVTQALDERDLLVKKIQDKISKASFVDTIKPNEEKVLDARVSKDEFAKDAESAYQQIQDLIDRFKDEVKDSDMTDNEKEIVDKFLDENFPDGFIPEVKEGTEKEFNTYPAFGERNENALTNRGESPYLATKTIEVQFSQAGYFEARSEEDSDYATHVVVDNTADAAKLSPKQDVEEESHYHFGR